MVQWLRGNNGAADGRVARGWSELSKAVAVPPLSHGLRRVERHERTVGQRVDHVQRRLQVLDPARAAASDRADRRARQRGYHSGADAAPYDFLYQHLPDRTRRHRPRLPRLHLRPLFREPPRRQERQLPLVLAALEVLSLDC